MQPPRSGCNPRGFPDPPSLRVAGSGLRTGGAPVGPPQGCAPALGQRFSPSPAAGNPPRARLGDSLPSVSPAACRSPDRLLFAADPLVIAAAPSRCRPAWQSGSPRPSARPFRGAAPGFGLRCATAGAAGPRRTLPFCCNGRVPAAVVPWAPRSIWLWWVVDSPQPFSSPCFFAGVV